MTIRGLLGAIVVLAVVCAALRYASDAWATAMCAIAVTTLAAAAVPAVLSRGATRTFWAGFAAIGAIYLALAFAPGLSSRVAPRLPTTWLLDGLYPIVHRPAEAQTSIPRGMFDESYSAWVDAHPGAEVTRLDFGGEDDMATIVWVVPAQAAFRRAGHAVLALALAGTGGAIVSWIDALRRNRPLPPSRRPADDIVGL